MLAAVLTTYIFGTTVKTNVIFPEPTPVCGVFDYSAPEARSISRYREGTLCRKKQCRSACTPI